MSDTVNLGAKILLEEVKNSIITLPKAVAKANNRASINAAQKAGRKQATGQALEALVALEVPVAQAKAQKAGRKRAATVTQEKLGKRVKKVPARYMD